VHAAARRVLPCATPEHPSSSAIGRVQCTIAVPQGLPNRPAPTAPPPRPDHSRTKAFRGGAPWPPVDGRPPVLPHPSTATNRLLVSPSTFPPIPRPNPSPECLNSGEPRRLVRPGATLQKRRSFRGPPCKCISQIVLQFS
jgi:hypothetical protein